MLVVGVLGADAERIDVGGDPVLGVVFVGLGRLRVLLVGIDEVAAGVGVRVVLRHAVLDDLLGRELVAGGVCALELSERVAAVGELPDAPAIVVAVRLDDVAGGLDVLNEAVGVGRSVAQLQLLPRWEHLLDDAPLGVVGVGRRGAVLEGHLRDAAFGVVLVPLPVARGIGA